MTRSSRFLLPFALVALAASLAVGVPRAVAIDPFPTDGVATLSSDHFKIHFSRDVSPCPTAAISQEQAGEILGMVERAYTLYSGWGYTAPIALGVAFGLPGLAVDTHVTRLTARLRLTAATDPVEIERDICAMVPAEEWTDLSLRLILHGRRVCVARSPRCPQCVLNDICPSAQLGPLRPRPSRRGAHATARTPRPRSPRGSCRNPGKAQDRGRWIERT